MYEDVSLAELSERALELTIWDHDRLASNEFLGGVRFSLGNGKSFGRCVGGRSHEDAIVLIYVSFSFLIYLFSLKKPHNGTLLFAAMGLFCFAYGTGKHNGRAVEWMDSTGKELSLWQNMINRPNFWVEGALVLRPSLENAKFST